MDKNNVLLKFARVISILFVPPAIALLTMSYFAFAFEKNLSTSMMVIMVTFVFGFILPIIVFFYLKRRGRILDIDATIKEERTLPFIIGILLYSVGIVIMIIAGVNLYTLSFWFSYIINTIILISINRFWKISVHALGVSGPLAALTFIWGWAGFSFIWLLIVICWARLKLKVHTPAQVIAGSIIGFILTYFQMELITGIFSHVI